MHRPVLGWLLARGLLLALILLAPGPVTDVNYYYANLAGGMAEYPHASVWPLHLLELLSPDREAFIALFVVMCLLIDAGFLLALIRLSTPTAAWFWVVAGGACGQILYLRLDLIPAVLVGLTALLLVGRPRLAAGLLAAATAVKLWPGVLAAGLVGRAGSRRTWVRVGWFFLVLAALCLLTVATAGWGRLVSPLDYQGERGLQIESIAATPVMFAAHLGVPGYVIDFAESKSWEITGPGVPALISLADVLQIGVVLAALGWALLSLRRGFRSPAAVAFFVAAIAWLIVTNKVFSPQYVIWLAPVVAVAIGARPGRLTVAIGTLVAVAAVLGVVVYPFGYGAVVNPDAGAGAVAVMGVLGLRNLLVLVAAVLAARWVWGEARADSEVEELRQPGRAAQPQ